MASQEERDRILAEYMAGAQDDDDDEGEFEPTGDETSSDEEHEEEEEDESGIVLTGSLGMRDDRLVYSGTWKPSTGEHQKKFKLKSKPQKLPLHWDASRPTVSDASKKEIPRMRTICFDGFFISTTGDKMKERDVNITFTVNPTGVHGSSDIVNGKSYKSDGGSEEDGKLSSKPAAKTFKSDDDVQEKESKIPSKPTAQDSKGNEDSKIPSKAEVKDAANDEDGKMPAQAADSKASPSKAVANGTNKSSAVCAVFGRGTNDYGNFEFEGMWDNAGSELVCKKRYVQSGGSAAAAAAVTSDDEDSGADEELDYDELIALHQDAGLPVEELRKRYRDNGGSASVHSGSKRQRIEESDDEEFDGF